MELHQSHTLQYQLKNEFYKKIKSGEWLPGQLIPGEKELCEEYSVSRITVREALRELVQANYLVRKQGKGTFVAAPAIEYTLSSVFSLSKELEEKGLESEFILLDFRSEEADEFFLRAFKIEGGEHVVRTTRLRTISGEIYAYEEAVVPEKYLAGITQTDVDKNGLYPSMKAACGVFPEHAEESVEAVTCPDRVADAMGIDRGTAVFRIKRFTFAGDRCVEYCMSYVFGQRYNCRHTIRQK